MASNRSKLIQLTDYRSGAVFMVSSCQIISFTAIATTDAEVTYISQRGTLTKRRVLETVSAINTACISNGVNMMIPITLASSVVVYLNIDRVIYVDALSNSSPLLTAVTYDAGVNSPAIYKCSLPTPANFQAATDNLFAVTTQATISIPSRTRYINNEKISAVSSEAVGAEADLQLLMRPESYTVGAAGTGYTSAPAVAITGGGGSGATATSTLKLLSSVVAAAGTGYAPTNTITLAGGTSTTTAIATVATTKLVSAAVNATGSGYVAGDTITLAGGTFSTPAILTVLTETLGAVTTFSISTAGSYTVNSTTFTQSATSGVGTGATFNTGLFGVNTLTVNTAGVYTVLPSNPISQASSSGSGTGATLTGTWGVNTVVLGANGSGYSSMPTVTISGGAGTGATATAVMEGDSIVVVDGGSGYTTTPTVSFTGGGGTLLAATVTINVATESITAGTVTVRGGGYTSFPTLVLTGGLGSILVYNEGKTEFIKLQVAETIVQVQTSVNAL
ncbi:MAG: hypothetical protein V4549_07340 [Bacteroidota bacterium]